MSTDLFNKHPHIQKTIKQFIDNGEFVSNFELRHLSFLITRYRDKIKSVKVAYNQFTSFKEFYKAILIITNAELERFSDHFSEGDLLAYCDEHNIVYEKTDEGVVKVTINTFEYMKYLGSTEWCITRSYKDFAKYNTQASEQYIVFNFNKQQSKYYRTGITNGSTVLMFDNNNDEINDKSIYNNDYNENIHRNYNEHIEYNDTHQLKDINYYVEKFPFLSGIFLTLGLIAFVFIFGFTMVVVNYFELESIKAYIFFGFYGIYYLFLLILIGFSGFISYFVLKNGTDDASSVSDFLLFLFMYVCTGGLVVSIPVFYIFLETPT